MMDWDYFFPQAKRSSRLASFDKWRAPDKVKVTNGGMIINKNN